MKHLVIIGKTYIVDTHWKCFYEAIPCVPTIYVTENKETSFKFTFKLPCSLSLPILNISNCHSVMEYLSLQHKLFKFS